MKDQYFYLLINLFSLSYPLFKSFDKRVNYYLKWKALFFGILFSGSIFIIWDVIFTNLGIWKFNPQYILGYYIINLPVEEWIFFIAIPFSSMFIYECYNYFVKKDILEKISTHITFFLIIFLMVVGLLNTDKLYTSVTFIFTSITLLIHYIIFKNRLIGRFLMSYLIILIPFLIVNGLLTSLPVLIYNDLENLSIRIYTIPIEDTVYGFLMILLNLSVYEPLKKKWNIQ